jgi:2-polyprenyl-6-methoxyphenol hydroxylase-like FAD-dependent oxidoreductase
MGSTDSPRLQVAICGAGIAGLTAAIALRKQPNIGVQIYEQASELKEIGASIALGPNGLRTLERLGLDNAIRDEIAYRGPSNIPMIYRHWKTDEVLGLDYHENVTEYLHRTARYLRTHLQEALLERVPKEIIHLGKRFAGAEVDSDGVSVSFEDGTTARADILVGADGLRSVSGSYFEKFVKRMQKLKRFVGREAILRTRIDIKMEWMDRVQGRLRLLTRGEHTKCPSRLHPLVGTRHQLHCFETGQKHIYGGWRSSSRPT